MPVAEILAAVSALTPLAGNLLALATAALPHATGQQQKADLEAAIARLAPLNDGLHNDIQAG